MNKENTNNQKVNKTVLKGYPITVIHTPDVDESFEMKKEKMHRNFIHRLSSAMAHTSAICSMVFCLTLGSGLIYDAATTNPSRFYAKLGSDDSLYLYTLSMRALNVPVALNNLAEETAPLPQPDETHMESIRIGVKH